jgi:hypothetical protein
LGQTGTVPLLLEGAPLLVPLLLVEEPPEPEPEPGPPSPVEVTWPPQAASKTSVDPSKSGFTLLE